MNKPKSVYYDVSMNEEKPEFTGQCIGGPDDGNMITASVRVVTFGAVFNRYLDGPNRRAVPQKITGTYEWDDSHGVFHWIRSK